MSSVLLNKNYEEFMISNLRKLQSENPNDCRSWTVIAKILFPNDFNVQFEAYKIERHYRNTERAAKCFAELLKKFPDEPGLLNEMQKMTESLQSSPQSDETKFLKAVFQNLTNDQKYKILSTVATHCNDPMDHCTLMLLLLQELPSQLYQHGEKVINTLLNAENRSHCDRPVNRFRKLLVCDAMPILFSPNFEMTSKLLYCLLQTATEFFICYIFTSHKEDIDIDCFKIVKEDSCSSSKPEHKIWKPLFVLMETGGQQLHWSLAELFSSQTNFLCEMNWETVCSKIEKKLSLSDHGTLASSASYSCSPHDKEVFFCSTVIFFYSLYQFSNFIGPKFFFKVPSTNVHYILIEGIYGFAEQESIEPVSKKFKYDRDAKKLEKNPPLTVSQTVSADVADSVTQSFITAIKMWELIHKNYVLSNTFSALYKLIEMEQWPCFQEFYIDMLMYQGLHKEVVNHLSIIIQASTDEFIKNKARLQLASCFNFAGDYAKACDCLFDVICTFSFTNIGSIDIQLPAAKAIHHLHFISYSLDEILHYCIELLICIYKTKLEMGMKDSAMLGHIVVLSQYKWPREEDLFLQCIRIIQMNESFCYGKFFDYIVVPGILEEFMYLTTTEGGNVTLDLLPTSTMQIGKQRAVTRGVNKGAKDDLRENMKKQMARCEDDLTELFVTFIMQERYCIKRIII